MSAITGIFNRNGSPVNPEIIARMMDSVIHRGSDGQGKWNGGSVSLAHLHLATTPESVGEQQPLVDTDSGLTITFYGRIDNRNELLSQLEAHGLQLFRNTDTELVIKAYECWGVDCAVHLLGDFTFAVWDTRKQQLFCARDIRGIKPFYYHCTHSHFVFGTELEQLFQHPGVSAEINEGMVGEHLVFEFANNEDTLYKDILRLPPAHYLLVDASQFQIRRYWNIEPGKKIHYRRDEEYLEHFLELFREAVDCRLWCNGKVGATLSGGLDSPLVASMAQKLLNEKSGKERLETFSIILPALGDDESRLIKRIANQTGVISNFIPYDRSCFDDAPGWDHQALGSHELPNGPLTILFAQLQEAANSRDIRVLLTGTGADVILGGSDYPYYSLARNLKLPRLFNELLYQIYAGGWKRAFSLFLRSAIWPALPRTFRRKLASSRRKLFRSEVLQEEFINKIGLGQRLARTGHAEQFSDLAQWQMHQALMLGRFAYGMELGERSDARFGLEERHPFMDRRLIEFAAAVPDYQHHYVNLNKLLIRSAGQTLMPGIEPYRDFESHFTSCVVDALMCGAARNAFEALSIAEAGWVSKNNVDQAYAKLSSRYHSGTALQDADYRQVKQLLGVFLIEKWYQST